MLYPLSYEAAKQTVEDSSAPLYPSFWESPSAAPRCVAKEKIEALVGPPGLGSGANRDQEGEGASRGPTRTVRRVRLTLACILGLLLLALPAQGPLVTGSIVDEDHTADLDDGEY